MDGIIILDKPKEFTSFDVVAVLRKTLKIKKIGHTGTLDPMATGALPVLIGNATKIQDLMPNHDKEYVARFKIGVSTDTLDITGEVLEEEASSVTKEELLSILKNFTGEIGQLPPMYSAVQKNGVRLYDLARKGIEVEREKRLITIYELKLLEFDEKNQEGTIFIKCSRGTYIRSLCDDIGKQLGYCGAVLTSLRRTMACGFSIEDGVTLDLVKKLAEQNKISEKIIPVEKIFLCYNKVMVTKLQAKRFKNGGALDINRICIPSDTKDQEILRVYDENVFLGLAKINFCKNELAILKLLSFN